MVQLIKKMIWLKVKGHNLKQFFPTAVKGNSRVIISELNDTQ